MSSNMSLNWTADRASVRGLAFGAAASYFSRYISWGSALSGLKMSAKLLAPR